MQSLYPSNGFVDELAWAAAWLYSASNSTASNYLIDARKYYAQAVSQQVCETFQWPCRQQQAVLRVPELSAGNEIITCHSQWQVFLTGFKGTMLFKW